MRFKATVNVRLRGSVSDAAGNAVMNNTHRVAEGLQSHLLRIGKVIDYWFDAEDYETAEKYLKKALLIMPDDPIVNDHYADVLWKLNKKIQAKYFWESVLNLDSADEEMKNKIFKKLLKGPDQV